MLARAVAAAVAPRASGAGSRTATHAPNGRSTAPFAAECQSFLDVVAGFGRLDNGMIRIWQPNTGGSSLDAVRRSNPQRDCGSVYSGFGRGCYSDMEQSASRRATSSISGGGDVPG